MRDRPGDQLAARGGRLLARAVLALAASGLLTPWVGNARAADRPAWQAEVDAAMQDDPRTTMADLQARLQATQAASDRFWTLLALARTQNQLEQSADAVATTQQAAEALRADTSASASQRLWLELAQLQVGWTLATPADAQARLRALQPRVAAQTDPHLRCEFTELELALLLDIQSLDEAWLAAEAVERCGRATGSVEREAGGILSLGQLVRKGRGSNLGEADTLFQRAEQVLGNRPARQLRSIIAWDHGITLGQGQRWDAALARLREAQSLSRDIGDSAGVAAASTEMAQLHLQRDQPALALPLLAESRRLLADTDGGYRLPTVARAELQALARLKRPEALAAIDRARRWDTDTLPAQERARLVRAMAEAYASQGRFAQAWAEVQRSDALLEAGRRQATDVQVNRLQARYATAQREAENAALRHRSETAQLALEAQSARQRALWAAIGTLGLGLAAVLAWGWRAFAQRRQLADLALRDELTGQPNRRAVTAYAQAQFGQARKLGVPLSVAMIDLDHFKQVNDSLGHAGGDAVLRALVAAARSVLRGQDRLGRWGGEEWLLVMPGTSVAELPAVFERLRAQFAATPAVGVTGPHGCSFSMGGAEMRADTPSLDALVAEADRQLYQAKADGRDCLRS
ncbi:GGDEF domain-containing protein [Rubrivivax pictus]|uniref:diguanylate cyclase n=2 Tax=Pseudaquabacterium pictum TaxID=2315236 RepID=A0A480AI48_9BURK|nr:GGDEF domain-containing protein [Rubrivivax pictus]